MKLLILIGTLMCASSLVSIIGAIVRQDLSGWPFNLMLGTGVATAISVFSVLLVTGVRELFKK